MSQKGLSIERVGMRQSFAIPYGERHGRLLHVSEVNRGLKCGCLCPVCKDPLVARKGPKTTHHFAHKSCSICNSETVLHELGKRLLYNRVLAAIATENVVNITWRCETCLDDHTDNLIKLASSVELEQPLGPCRPDITLRDSAGSPVALVEIVVSHKPEDSVRSYAADNRLPIVEFELKYAQDLEKLSGEDVLAPTRVSLCTRPKCHRCAKPLYQKRLHVIDGTCWKCQRPMKIAFLNIERMMKHPEVFRNEDITVARQRGALLQSNWSKTMGRRYMSNTCPHCHAFSGTNFLHDYWYLMSIENGVDAGMACMSCDYKD